MSLTNTVLNRRNFLKFVAPTVAVGFISPKRAVGQINATNSVFQSTASTNAPTYTKTMVKEGARLFHQRAQVLNKMMESRKTWQTMPFYLAGGATAAGWAAALVMGFKGMAKELAKARSEQKKIHRVDAFFENHPNRLIGLMFFNPVISFLFAIGSILLFEPGEGLIDRERKKYPDFFKDVDNVIGRLKQEGAPEKLLQSLGHWDIPFQINNYGPFFTTLDRAYNARVTPELKEAVRAAEIDFSTNVVAGFPLTHRELSNHISSIKQRLE